MCHWMWSRAAANPHLASEVGEMGIPAVPRLLDKGVKDSGVLHARPSLAACAASPAEPLPELAAPRALFCPVCLGAVAQQDSPVLGTCPTL